MNTLKIENLHKLSVILFIVFFTSVNYSCIDKPKIYSDGYIVKPGDKAPDFTINEAGGSSYRLADLKGKVVMLQFTASWCSVCRTEMPFIEDEIWQTNKDKGLVVIGIDRDEPVETVLDFSKKMGITYKLALDPGARIFGLFAKKEAGVTRNIIIDREGKIVLLTRLYKREEFDNMKKVINAELAKI